METKQIKQIAISAKDFEKYGCPDCGGIFGYSNFSGGGAALWNCECGATIVVLADGIITSPISISDITPILQEHPRKDFPIDREKLIKERAENISSSEIDSLTKWMRLGYGEEIEIKVVDHHSSKSRTLPIISAVPKSGSNVQVTWFAQNFYFHFLGVKFEEPLYATLLYPISNLFDRYALSGHVNTKLAPPITNIMKHYHNQELLKNFGMDCGNGFFAALVVRYLHEVSKLDKEKIMDLCLRKSQYGKVDIIDGNSLDFDELVDVVGLVGEKKYCEFEVATSEESIFSKITIDEFDTDLHNSSVHITLKDGVILPALPISSSNVYLKPSETILGKYITDKTKDESENLIDTFIKVISTSSIEYMQGTRENRIKLHDCPYPYHCCYSDENLDAKNFTINVPNPLDALLVGLFLTKVVDPIVKAMLFTV